MLQKHHTPGRTDRTGEEKLDHRKPTHGEGRKVAQRHVPKKPHTQTYYANSRDNVSQPNLATAETDANLHHITSR